MDCSNCMAPPRAGVATPASNTTPGATPKDVPAGQAADGANLVGQMPAAGGSDEKAWVRYTVRPGDTLSKIAAEAGTTVAELLKRNPSITNPDLIRVGQELKVPAGYEGGERRQGWRRTSGGGGGSSQQPPRSGSNPPAAGSSGGTVSSGGNQPGTGGSDGGPAVDPNQPARTTQRLENGTIYYRTPEQGGTIYRPDSGGGYIPE